MSNTCDTSTLVNSTMDAVYTAIEESETLGSVIGTLNDAQDAAQAIISGTDNATQERDEENWSSWSNRFKPQSEFDDDNSTIKFLTKGIKVRHNALKHTENYESDCSSNVQQTMTQFKNNELADFNKLKQFMSSFLISYKSLFDYKTSVSAIYNEKKERLGNIQSKIDTYKQNVFIDEQKNKYQSSNYEFYNSFNFYIIIIYYFIFALFFIFSDFIREKKYKDYKLTSFIITLLLFPFILKYILVLLHNIYIFVLEYYNLRGDVISYPYILNKFHGNEEEV